MWITKYCQDAWNTLYSIQCVIPNKSAPRLQVYEQNDNGYMLDETHGDSNPKKKREEDPLCLYFLKKKREKVGYTFLPLEQKKKQRETRPFVLIARIEDCKRQQIVFKHYTIHSICNLLFQDLHFERFSLTYRERVAMFQSIESIQNNEDKLIIYIQCVDRADKRILTKENV